MLILLYCRNDSKMKLIQLVKLMCIYSVCNHAMIFETAFAKTKSTGMLKAVSKRLF